jgi:hypothetical protein
MPNGTGKSWTTRRESVLFKVVLSVGVPVVAWTLLTVIAHSEELAARGAVADRTEAEQAQAEAERLEIARRLERVEERVGNYQESNREAHERQERALERILEAVER